MKTKKGFTLIELMIVVAIIGVLAAVAIPKFANLIRKAKEASAKGQLGAVRSAVSIYYGDLEGNWPVALSGMTPTYMQEIPSVDTGVPGQAASAVQTTENDGATGITEANATGGWWYNNGPTGSDTTSGVYDGQVRINLAQTAINTSYIHTW